MSDKNLFQKWLVKSTKGSPVENITHTSFSGGSFVIPFADRTEFFELYLSAVRNNKSVYMTERISAHQDKLFNFFIDFDLDFDSKPPNHVEWYKIVNEIMVSMKNLSTKISEHIEKKGFVVTVRWSITKEIYKLHLNFPELVVNKDQAIYIRNEIIRDISTKVDKIVFHYKLFPEKIEKIFDKQVYLSNGLRMLWSKKSSKMIKKDEPSNYDKYYKIVEFIENEWICNKTITVEDLEICSLTPAPNASLVDTDLYQSQETQVLCKVSEKSSDLPEKDKSRLLKFIQSNYLFKPHQVMEMKQLNNCICAVIDSDYCDLKKAKHGGNKRMRIVINKNGSYQKCYSTKLEICTNGKHNKMTFEQLPANIQKIVKNLDDDVDSPNQLQVFNNIASQPFEGQLELLNNMDMKLGKPTTTQVGWKCRLVDNLFCPVCKSYHSSPQNYLLITDKGQKMIGCCIDIDKYFPDPPMMVDTSQINILFQNITNITVIDGEQLRSEAKFDKIEPIFNDKELDSFIYMSLGNLASRIADVFYYIAKDKFAVDSKKDWWVWDAESTRWIKEDDTIFTFCNDEVGALYEKVQSYYNSITTDKALAAARERCIYSIRKRIEDKDKSTIMQETAQKFRKYSKHFEEKLDVDKSLLAFVGGVYDFKNCEYRPIKSSDYTSLSTGYTLPDCVDENIRSEIMIFLSSIMPNEEELHYLLKWLASCLDGYNKYEIFTIMTGVGRNGKGVLCELMAQTLGGDTGYGYAHSIQASMLTHTRPVSSGPCPDLLYLEGKRWACGSEPEKGSSINGGFLKFLTGNDPISGRFCHSNSEVKFKPQHSLVIQCNDVPKLDSDDEAIWDRGRIINFPFKFVDNPKELHEKLIDRSLKEKIGTWCPQFMLLLLEYYQVYLTEGLSPSNSVTEMSRKVRKENDVYLDFIEDNLEKTEHKSIMTCNEINTLYKTYSGSQKSTLHKLNEALKRYGFVYNAHCYQKGTYSGLKGYTNIKRKVDLYDSSK